MGARRLRTWLNAPLRDQPQVRERHRAVAALLDTHAFEDLGPALRKVGDLERIVTRIALGNASPRDLAKLRTALGVLPDIRTRVAELDAPGLTDRFADLADFTAETGLLQVALVTEPPAVIRDGGVLARGYDAELDGLRDLHRERQRLPGGARSPRTRADRDRLAQGRLPTAYTATTSKLAARPPIPCRRSTCAGRR